MDGGNIYPEEMYEQMGAHLGRLCPASSGQEKHGTSGKQPAYTYISTQTDVWFRRMCGCGFRSEERAHGRNKTEEEETEQEQPMRKSLERRVVGKPREKKERGTRTR